MLRTVYKKYKEAKDIGMLLFFIAGLFLYFSAAFLITGDFSLSYLGLLELGDITLIIAASCICVSLVLESIFSIRVTFPERVKSLGTFIILIVAIFIIAFSWATLQGPPFSSINLIDIDIYFSPIMNLIFFICLFPAGLFAPAVFFYFAIKVRKDNKPQSTRSILFGFGLLFITIYIFFEIISLVGYLILVPLRIILILFFLIFMDLCFGMPDWFKRKIGWSD